VFVWPTIFKGYFYFFLDIPEDAIKEDSDDESRQNPDERISSELDCGRVFLRFVFPVAQGVASGLVCLFGSLLS
jgi:hypothetical protein